MHEYFKRMTLDVKLFALLLDWMAKISGPLVGPKYIFHHDLTVRVDLEQLISEAGRGDPGNCLEVVVKCSVHGYVASILIY
jgi:hypothetical protein